MNAKANVTVIPTVLDEAFLLASSALKGWQGVVLAVFARSRLSARL